MCHLLCRGQSKRVLLIGKKMFLDIVVSGDVLYNHPEKPQLLYGIFKSSSSNYDHEHCVCVPIISTKWLAGGLEFLFSFFLYLAFCILAP